MDFEFTDDQISLRDAVARWVEKGFDFGRRHALAKAGGMTRAVYAELAGLGLAGLVVPEDHGGMGFGPVEALVVMEELGRGLVNAPYAAAALVTPTLLSAAPPALQSVWLTRIAEGQALVVPALQERASRYQARRVLSRAQPQGAGFVLQGHKSVVPAADEADAFIVPARLKGADDDTAGIGLFLVEAGAPGLAIRPYPTQDGARAAEVQFDGTPAMLVTAAAWDTLERAQDVGIAASCAEGVGVMDRLVAMTAEYLNTRKQFGVALATFQVLRHRMADVKLQLELGRSMSYFATLKLQEPVAERRRALCQAKAQLGQSMRFVGQQCLQMHGGIGLTDEYAGSHHFKRLTMLEMAYGDTMHHLAEVGSRMQDSAGVLA